MATILIVDDEPSIRDFLSQLLADEGYSVQTAENGEEALRALHAAPPDLVLADIMMPRVNGLELCHRMQTQPGTSRVPVILFSAGRESMAKGRCHYTAFLPKPFNMTILLKTVMQVIERAP